MKLRHAQEGVDENPEQARGLPTTWQALRDLRSYRGTWLAGGRVDVLSSGPDDGPAVLLLHASSMASTSSPLPSQQSLGTQIR